MSHSAPVAYPYEFLNNSNNENLDLDLNMAGLSISDRVDTTYVPIPMFELSRNDVAMSTAMFKKAKNIFARAKTAFEAKKVKDVANKTRYHRAVRVMMKAREAYASATGCEDKMGPGISWAAVDMSDK
jgi:hypothetical protein